MPNAAETDARDRTRRGSFAEFRVVLLAGDVGSRMRLFTDAVPKCLLPIGNRPMLFYALYTIERNSIPEVTLVTTERALERVTSYVEELYGNDPAVMALRSSRSSQPDLHVCIEAVPAELGSGEALLKVTKYLDAEDVLVVSADTFGLWDLASLATTHRVTGATWTMMLANAKFGAKSDHNKRSAKSLGPAHGSSTAADQMAIGTPSRDCIVVDEVTQRILYLKPDVGAFGSADNIRLPRDALQAVGPMMIHRDLLDLHIYLFRKTALELLSVRPQLTSLRADLLPYLARNQFVLERRLARALGSEMTGGRESPLRTAWQRYRNAPAGSASRVRSVSPHRKSGEKDNCWLPSLEPLPLHSIMIGQSQTDSVRHGPVSIRCQGCFSAPEAGRIIRVNTISAYIEANRLVAAGVVYGDLRGASAVTPKRGCSEAATQGGTVQITGKNEETEATRGEQASARVHIAKDCLIAAEGVEISPGSTIKNQTVVHVHTIVGRRCKLSACIIMDHVRIGNECLLQNCVVGSNAQIHDRCQLRDCLVGPDTEVPAGTIETGEVFTRADIPLVD